MSKEVSNETLAKKAVALVKKGFLVNAAVRRVFQKQHIFNPPRFGQICRLVEFDIKSSLATEKEKSHSQWYQTGSMA